jgi:hypothetical protein
MILKKVTIPWYGTILQRTPMVFTDFSLTDDNYLGILTETDFKISR